MLKTADKLINFFYVIVVTQYYNFTLERKERAQLVMYTVYLF